MEEQNRKAGTDTHAPSWFRTRHHTTLLTERAFTGIQYLNSSNVIRTLKQKVDFSFYFSPSLSLLQTHRDSINQHDY
jgi:hypothetical protein